MCYNIYVVKNFVKKEVDFVFLDIITGGTGAKKSEYLYELIRENLKNNPDSNAIVVVPEQFSYNTEKILSEKFGGLGLNRIEVLTFSRLMSRYISAENNLLPSGKTMLLAKAISKIGEDNAFFPSAKKNGFVASFSELLSEFKRYNITLEDLDGLATENPLSQKRLDSVCEIYRNYLEAFGEEFTDSDDAPTLFAEYINSSNTFSDTFFFFDEYNDFMPQHYEIIRAMIKKSRGVFVTLTIGNTDPSGVFAPVLKTKSRLSHIALSENAQLNIKELCEEESSATPDIAHLLAHWDIGKQFSGKCENISIFSAKDLYSEVEHTAAKITELVRDKGLRYRDIGVIVGNMPSYLHMLNAIFKENDIPFFCDEKLSVTMHPIARTVLSLFKIIDSDWSYSSVFDYLKAGYVFIKDENGVAPINPEDVDILENYVLANGIRGKKAWFSSWTETGETIFDEVITNYKKQDYDLLRLNELRQKIVLPFENFLENKGRTVKAIAEAFYNFLCDINLYEGIASVCEKFDKDGLRDESEQFKQVWNAILEVLDQAVVSLGNDVISRENFFRYIMCGLSQFGLSIIPSGLDRVSVGTVGRNSACRVKALFIIGTLHGAIPEVPSCSTIFSAFDRARINEALSGKEKELAPDDLGRLALSNFKLYRTVATATEKLYISYPISDSEGNALSPSRFVSTLKKMFPDIKKLDNVITEPDCKELLSSPKRGFYYMLSKVSEYYKSDPDALWKSAFKWYSENPEYKERLGILKAAAAYKKTTPRLSKLKAQVLFGKGKKYSITALEKYNKCPFSYYMEKGLKAMPQEVKQVEKSHIGSLVHAAICRFCEEVENGAETIEEIHKKWVNLTENAQNAIISSIMADMKEKILKHADSDKNRVEYLLLRCENTLKKSANTIRKSISLGGYTAVCYEKDFEVDIDWKSETITLFGTIDRIDIMEKIAENRADIRILDYKTGRKEFSIASIVNKLDMQLVLYAIAAKSLYEKGEIRGTNAKLSPRISAVFYNKINDNILKIDKNTPEAVEKELKKKNMLDGMIVLDDDQNTIADMDKTFESNGESEIFKISINSKNEFGAFSQVSSRDDFESLCQYMKKTAIDTHKSIKDGVISVSPRGKSAKSMPCTYCDFKDVCLFDAKNNPGKSIGSKNAFEFVRKELEENE